MFVVRPFNANLGPTTLNTFKPSLKVYERTRGDEGAHPGGKYKLFVNLKSDISYYSQKAAIGAGYKADD